MASIEGNGKGDIVRTFRGKGFGTRVIRRDARAEEAPRVASQRGELRRKLPAMYQDDDFTMRFVGAFEGVLDPIDAVLDNLSSYIEPAVAPQDMLELMSAWLGYDVDESQSMELQRTFVSRTIELSRYRGTKRGLELSLQLAFPELPLRVEDPGGVHWSRDESKLPEPPIQEFYVYCDDPVPDETQAAIARIIDQAKPVNVSYRLRVRIDKAEAD